MKQWIARQVWLWKHRKDKKVRQYYRRMRRDLMVTAFVIGAFLLASVDWTVIR